MRRFLAILLILPVLCICGCRKSDDFADYVDIDQPDYLGQIREDLFAEDTVLAQTMNETVAFYLDEVTEQTITVTVVAPDVCDEAISWFQAVSEEEYTDHALEEKLIELMAGEMMESQFILDIYAEEIIYTDEFLDAASCGVRDFYGKLTAMVIAEMEENLNA